MSRLEEEFTKNQILVDIFQARRNHIKTGGFSALLALIYAAYLWFVCSTTPSTTSTILLFGSQIAIGFPAARAYYEWGVSNKEKLQFIDPAKFNTKGKRVEIDIHLGDLPVFFEKLEFQTSRYDRGSFDDLTDIAWFGIFVWASISSLLFILNFGGYPLCMAGSFVLMIALLGSYLSGYWKTRERAFEDDLIHLQYFVEKRYKHLDVHLPKKGSRIYIQMLEKWRSMVLIEFSLEIPLGNDESLEYHMGLSSTEKERIVIKAAADVLNRVYLGSEKLAAIKEHGWLIERILTPSGPIVRVLNQSSDFSLSDRSSYVKSPSRIDEASEIVGSIFAQVVSFTL
ncbi:MAG: hypothetical protein ACFFEE_05520 [Candidatus Thorarchaeota archaeon]